MQHNPECIIIVGNIGSGKSTLTLEYARNGYIIVNDDAVVNALHIENTLYNKNLKPLYKQIENTIINFALGNKYSVIVDRPNITRQTRARYISLAKSLDIPVKCIYFEDRGEESHINRRMKNPRGYSREQWIKVYQYNKSIFEPPSLDEGFEEITIGNKK